MRDRNAIPIAQSRIAQPTMFSDNLNPQLEQMADESMVRNLAAQAVAIWPQERDLFLREPVPAAGRRVPRRRTGSDPPTRPARRRHSVDPSRRRPPVHDSVTWLDTSAAGVRPALSTIDHGASVITHNRRPERPILPPTVTSRPRPCARSAAEEDESLVVVGERYPAGAGFVAPLPDRPAEDAGRGHERMGPLLRLLEGRRVAGPGLVEQVELQGAVG